MPVNPKSLKNLKPVKKGEVLNPHGINRKRPYSDRMFQQSEELLAATPTGQKVLEALDLPQEATWADAAVHKLMREAVKGNIAAVREMADRIEGRAPTRLEITTAPKTEVTFEIVLARPQVRQFLRYSHS